MNSSVNPVLHEYRLLFVALRAFRLHLSLREINAPFSRRAKKKSFSVGECSIKRNATVARLIDDRSIYSTSSFCVNTARAGSTLSILFSHEIFFDRERGNQIAGRRVDQQSCNLVCSWILTKRRDEKNRNMSAGGTSLRACFCLLCRSIPAPRFLLILFHVSSRKWCITNHLDFLHRLSPSGIIRHMHRLCLIEDDGQEY